MHRGSRNEGAGFFWQGLLIVLPVVLLAGLGLFSLRQDRRLADQDARQRAQDIVQQLASGLGRRVGSHLEDPLASHWEMAYGQLLSASPGDSSAKRLWDMNRPIFEKQLAEWSASYPGLNAGDVLFVPASLSESGELVWPPPWQAAPAPPGWCNALSGAQRQAWQAAQALELGSSSDTWSIAAAWKSFQQSEVTLEAQVNAEFALLRLQARTNPPAVVAEQLWRFASQHRDVLTETGLPLPAVALGVALHASHETVITEPLFELLRMQLTTPSILTDLFLKQAEALAEVTPAPVLQSVCALRESWDHYERLRALVGALQRQWPVHGIVTTQVWCSANSERWLAFIQPSLAVTNAELAARLALATNRLNLVKFVSKTVIEHAFADALREAGLRLPGYFALAGQLEGERLRLGQEGTVSGMLPLSSGLLASSSGVISQPAMLLTNVPSTGLVPDQGLAFESMPGQPRFTLGIYLSDPGALYASQRQRSLWFGALILAVACAAVLGLVQARRALVREHQLNTLKTNFVSSVSHELRAPIASVRLLAESLERGKVPEPARQLQYFRFIVQECRRLSSLIGNVLDFSRIEQGRKRYEFELTDLRALVLETVQVLEPAAAEREVKLDLQLPKSSLPGIGPGTSGRSALITNTPEKTAAACEYYVDSGAIQQALVNLIDNALKHSPAHSQITVGLACNERLVRLWVQDHGSGIPASEHERIFERFYRLGSELRRETQGVGIGLSIVRHIVQGHGGRVTVESELGKGSRFTLEIPTQLEASKCTGDSSASSSP